MDYETIIKILTVLLLAATSVERFLEYVNKGIEALGLFSKTREGRLAALAEAQVKQFSAKVAAKTAADAPVVLQMEASKDWEMISKKFLLQMAGCLLGILLCARGEIGIFAMLKSPFGYTFWAKSADYLLTGILIGTGTEPIHALIRLLQAKKEMAQMN
ncbi:hypothetical protein L0128_00575 [candidate division KSB1 bacterium]|nr:hypothetical protein [candidate division KSB1 bacterium]